MIEEVLREENRILKNAFQKIANEKMTKREIYKLLEQTYYKVIPLERRTRLKVVKEQ